MYLYRTRIIEDTSDYVMSQADKDIESANNTDFDTNYMSQAVLVDDVTIAETTFVVYKSYSDFKALITGSITWADVKYTDAGGVHKLFLATNNPI